MYIGEQPKEVEREDNNHGVQMQCKSSKVPTHFTVPEQGEHRRGHGIKSSKHRNKRTAQQRQYRKLDKQSKRVKSLQEQYHDLQQQIKQLKQMVQMQVQTLTLTLIPNTNKNETIEVSNYDNSNSNRQKLINCFNYNSMNNNNSITVNKLRQLITNLFSYQQTISTANSNYLLLSQVNKQEEAESLFHIGNLQQRIRQLRFSLNTKQDLLAYQLSTIQNPQQGGLQDDDNKPIVIDYHLPKRPTMVNFNNVSIDFQNTQKAIKQVQTLKNVIMKLQKDLQLIYQQYESLNNKNNKENQEEQSGLTGEYKTIQMSDNNEKGLDNNSKAQSSTYNSIVNSNSNNNSSQNKITSNDNKNNNTNNNNNTKNKYNANDNNKPLNSNISTSQLYYLPLSITNYQNTLIYKATKMNQFQKEKSQTLKFMYKQLLRQYQQEVDRKRKLVSEYEIQRDIFQYKKKQLRTSTVNNSSRSLIRNNLHQISEESEDEVNSSSKTISTQNILAELKQQLSLHSETNIKESTIDNTDRLKEQQKITIKKEDEQQQQQLVLNEMNSKTNVKNPFLKLKLKPSYPSSTSITIPTFKPQQSIQPVSFNSELLKECINNNNNKQTLTNQNIQNLQNFIIPSNQLSQLGKPRLIKETPIKPKLQLPAYKKDKPLINQSHNLTIQSNN